MRSWSKVLAVLACAAAVLQSVPARAADPEVVRLGWYGAPRVWVAGKAAGLFEKAMGTKVEWVQFPSGAGALSALAARQVDIARMGSSPTVGGIARKLPVEMIAVAEVIATSERLVARSAIGSMADLKGKRIAYPPGSTAHYALMAALKVNQVPASQVTLLSLAPSEMLAAWRRGDIDAAYVWGPFSNSMEEAGGRQLMTTENLQKNGYFIFNTYVVRKEFAEKHPEKVVQFLRAFEQSIDMYRKDTEGTVRLIARHLDQKEDQVRATLAGLYSPPLAEQLAAGKYLGEGGSVVPAMADTGRFLADLGELRASELPADFRPAVNTSYMKRALAK
jgi:taurine transport system substrate-binding protein